MDKRQAEVEKQLLKHEQACLKEMEKAYTEALADCKARLKALREREDQTPSVIYQIQFQEQMQRQLEGALSTLKSRVVTSVNDFLTKTYEDGYLGVIYGIQGQGIPINIGIDHDQMARTINRATDTFKFSDRLYKNVDELAVAFKSEMSRGIANGSTYSKIAKQLALQSEASYKRAMTIVRTEGGRVKSEAKLDSMKAAKKEGADIVKQWDSTFDGKTRAEHRYLDGQIREIDEPFTDSQGREAQAPHKFGIASMDINCRCIVVERARWAVEGEEMPNKVNNRTGDLVEAKDYAEWKEKAQKQLTEKKQKQYEKKLTEIERSGKRVFDADTGKLPDKGDYYRTPSNDLIEVVEVNDYNGIKSVTLANGQTVVLKNAKGNAKVDLAQTLKKVESDKQAFTYEVGTIINRNGEIIDTIGGAAHSIDIDEDTIPKLKNAIFTHNHPSGGSLARQDIESFIKADLFEIRASTPQGMYFGLKKKVDTPDAEGFIEAFRGEKVGDRRRAQDKLQQMLDSGEVTAEEWQRRGYSLIAELQEKDIAEWLKANAEKYGYIYEEGNI